MLYVLPGVGEVRTRRWPSRDVEARAADGRSYTFAPRGNERKAPTATDAFGEEAGQQHGSRSLVWRSIRWDLAPSSEGAAAFYALTRRGEERELARFTLGVWGKHPLPVVIDDDARRAPGLLLFALYLMRLNTDDVNRSAAGSAGHGGGGN